MLLQPVTISLLLTLLRFSQENDEDKTNLISAVKDLLDSQNFPAKVSAMLCWNRENSLKFSKIIYSSFNLNYVNLNLNVKISRNQWPEYQVFVIDLRCNQSLEILSFADDLKLFQQPFKWIIFSSNDNDNLLLKDFYFSVDSKIYIINENGVKTLYKYTKTSNNFVETSLSTWTSNIISNDFTDYSFVRNRTDINGALLNISIVVTNPETVQHFWDYRHKHIDAITKLNYILMHHLTDYINASRRFIMQPTWGYKNASTGIYSGMVGDLQLEIAEIGGTPLFFTMDRVDIIDYIAATTPTYMKFIFRAPPLSYVTNVFTLPFDTTVWHYSFVMVAVILACVYVIVIWEWKDPEFRVRIQDKYNTLRPNIFDVFMMEIGAITQQGTDVEPKSVSGRIATIFTFVALMFMYTSYSANIVALLQSTTDSIRSLEDLLNSRIKIGVEDIVYAHYYFENAKEPVKKAIYEQKVAPKGQKANFMTVQEGIRRVQEGFFAFHVELATGYKVVNEIFQENEKCGLKEVVYVNLIEPWLSIQKNSVYKEIMKIGMRKIHESGVQRREVHRIYTRKPVCHTRGNNFGSVGLIDCYSAFLIFGIGIASGIFLLVFEVIIMRCSLRRASNNITIVDNRDLDSNNPVTPDHGSEFIN